MRGYERQAGEDWRDGRGFLKVLHLLTGTEGCNKNRREKIQLLRHTV